LSLIFANTLKIDISSPIFEGSGEIVLGYKAFGQDGIVGAFFFDGEIVWDREKEYTKPRSLYDEKAYHIKDGKKYPILRKELSHEDLLLLGDEKVANNVPLFRLKDISKKIVKKHVEEWLQSARYEQVNRKAPLDSKLSKFEDYSKREGSYRHISEGIPSSDPEIERLRKLHEQPGPLPFNLPATRITNVRQFEKDFNTNLAELQIGQVLTATRMQSCSVAKIFSAVQKVIAISHRIKPQDILYLRIAVIKGTRALLVNDHILKKEEFGNRKAYFGEAEEIDLPRNTKFKIQGLKGNNLFLITIP